MSRPNCFIYRRVERVTSIQRRSFVFCAGQNTVHLQVSHQDDSATELFLLPDRPHGTVVSTYRLSLRFNGHFPGEPGLAGVYRSKGGGDNWSYKSCKAPVKSSSTNKPTPSFTGPMPFLSPNQQCQSTEGKISHSMDLLTPSSPGVFQLCL